MSDPIPNDPSGRQYSSAAEGQKQLAARYEYWTAKVGELSFQASLALIAANWAVFAADLQKHSFAVASVLTAALGMLVSLVGAAYMAKLHYDAYYEAERDREKWRKRWEASERIDSQWPFNESIICVGKWFKVFRAVLPIMSGLLLVLAVITKPAQPA